MSTVATSILVTFFKRAPNRIPIFSAVSAAVTAAFKASSSLVAEKMTATTVLENPGKD